MIKWIRLLALCQYETTDILLCVQILARRAALVETGEESMKRMNEYESFSVVETVTRNGPCG